MKNAGDRGAIAPNEFFQQQCSIIAQNLKFYPNFRCYVAEN